MIRIATPPTGPQLLIAGRRIHHFASGVALVIVGALMCIHDRRDARICWRDLRSKHR